MEDEQCNLWVPGSECYLLPDLSALIYISRSYESYFKEGTAWNDYENKEKEERNEKEDKERKLNKWESEPSIDK